jgi:16S rRNA (cytosine1402-N4)-methyltransferase
MNASTADRDSRHVPVLLDEMLAQIDPRHDGIYVDGTFGAGGYSSALLAAGVGQVIAIDRDGHAIEAGQSMARDSGGRLQLRCSEFADLDLVAIAAGFDKVDGVVLDIGVSSMQLDTAERGFSFRRDGPLDMRMAQQGPPASLVVNTYGAVDLARIIRTLGEERRAGRIAREIVARRAEHAIDTTAKLAQLIETIMPRRPGDRIHPATRTFQALRIYVNRELEQLVLALAAAERILRTGGRLVVIAFHSLEDRIVKRFLAQRGPTGAGGSRHLPEKQSPAPTFEILTRRPIEPHEREIKANSRARSARLRAGLRTASPAWLDAPAHLGLPGLPALASGSVWQ